MLRKMSLKVKLIALFLLIGIVPAVLIGLFSYNSAQEEIRAGVIKQLELYAGQCSSSMNDYFEDIANDARVMAGAQ